MLSEWETIRSEAEGAQSLEIEWMHQQSSPVESEDLVDSGPGADGTPDQNEVPAIELCNISEGERLEEACGVQLEDDSGGEPMQNPQFCNFLETAAQRGEKLDLVLKALSECGMVECKLNANAKMKRGPTNTERTQLQEL